MSQTLLAPGRNPATMTAEANAADFSDYPKHMHHPGFQPGVADTEYKILKADGSPSGMVTYSGGKPIRYPPVLVHTPDQEEQHAAMGYVSVGKSDPAAFARAVAGTMPVTSDYKPVEYPKWIDGPNGKVLVQDVEQERLILSLDVLDDPQEAVALAVSLGVFPNVREPEPSAAEIENAALKEQLAEMRAMLEQLTAPKVDVPVEPEPAKEAVPEKVRAKGGAKSEAM